MSSFPKNNDVEHPLRVLFVLNAPGGGATQGILELLKGLPDEGFEAYCVMPGPPNAQQQETLTQLGVVWQVVPMAWWNRKVQWPWWWRMLRWGQHTVASVFRMRALGRLVRLLRAWQIDVVYTGTALTVEGALAARLVGLPHVWHIKETIGTHGRVQFPLPDAWLARFMALLSERVIVMTRFIGQAFAGRVSPGKVVVVYDGVDVDAFGGNRDGRALRRALGVADDEVLIAMSASLSSVWKQHALFIEMAAALSDTFPRARFAAFGSEPRRARWKAEDGPWTYYQELQQQVAQRGLAPRFVWAGFHPDIPQMMEAIDVLVHPCSQEPFGRVVIEAMAAGKPVVGPRVGGVAEAVVDQETGLLVEPDRASALAEATACLLQDAALRARMGAAGRRRVAASFSLENHVQQVAHLLRQVARRT